MSSAKKQRATKASAKNISKYASKFVGSIIDKAIIKTLLESRKGPISVSVSFSQPPYLLICISFSIDIIVVADDFVYFYSVLDTRLRNGWQR